ncbi:MAG: hypothetical protein Q8S54_05280 [Bacteroidota bacterium]|nr:hypothetical protein [Odoribacter sp.]MDP3642589.1 hypothetical protein [Bacteroidota bacterium]
MSNIYDNPTTLIYEKLIPGIAFEQVAQSVLRAVENRVAVVKTDVAYAAAIIDPNGNIIAL